jgi:FKBP-type peptidyl-prolyl cis-trans isomerase
MATSTAQRTGIWIIAIVLTVGTIAVFVAMILAPQNVAADSTRMQKVYAEYQKKVEAQNAELSKKYYPIFSQYADKPAAFDASAVTELKTDDLKIGDGDTIAAGTPYSAYYIGWNPSGKVFDQSIEGGSLKAPIAGGNLIQGWNEGVVGMKVNGVRLITIPAAKAYAEAGQGEDIPPNTPLKFIVFIIPAVQQPEIPKELLQSYGG